jgi:hypothetical protein
MKIPKVGWLVPVAFVAVGLAGPQQVQANQITGSIKFKGFVTLSKDPTKGTSTLTFDSVVTTFASGAYDVVDDGTQVAFATFSFNDATRKIVGGPPIDILFLADLAKPWDHLSVYFGRL